MTYKSFSTELSFPERKCAWLAVLKRIVDDTNIGVESTDACRGSKVRGSIASSYSPLEEPLIWLPIFQKKDLKLQRIAIQSNKLH